MDRISGFCTLRVQSTNVGDLYKTNRGNKGKKMKETCVKNLLGFLFS